MVVLILGVHRDHVCGDRVGGVAWRKLGWDSSGLGNMVWNVMKGLFSKSSGVLRYRWRCRMGKHISVIRRVGALFVNGSKHHSSEISRRKEYIRSCTTNHDGLNLIVLRPIHGLFSFLLCPALRGRLH